MLSIGRRQMSRGESKAKDLKRRGRANSAATKTKTRSGRGGTSKKPTVRAAAVTNRDESIAGLKAELAAAQKREAVTAEVLRLISRSTPDLQTVLNTLVESAARVCEADLATLTRPKGESFEQVAWYGYLPEHADYAKAHPIIPAGRGTVSGRTMLEGKVVHILDIQADPEHTRDPNVSQLDTLMSPRTMLGVPLIREGATIGVFALQRKTVQPFTDQQIELVTTFADQAVIAIENARLFDEVQARTKELTESLEQQTATSEVLRVISSSPGELEPVFEAMLLNATRVCEAKFGLMFRYDHDRMSVAATRDLPAPLAEFLSRSSGVEVMPPPGSPLEIMMRTKKVPHTPDGATTKFPSPAARLGGARSTVAVPMLKNDELIGAFVIYRQEVNPFTDKQIALVQTFADQAVIAIENTRLLNELRESLQQQTATADVLKVISRSTFDLRTVLDTLVASAARLCEADKAAISRPKGPVFEHLTSWGYSPEHSEYLKTHPIPSGRGSVSGRTVHEGKVVHIVDVNADPEYTLADGEKFNVRTMLGVPLTREGAVIGVIVLQRAVVRPFTDKQVELASTFADQAVIAIENARLFDEVQARTRELTESLEQQTATSEVLQVISSSPNDLQPVFDSMLANATRLCNAPFGTLSLYHGDVFHLAAAHNAPPAFIEAAGRELFRPPPGSAHARVVATKDVVHVLDAREDPAYAARDPVVVAAVELAGRRTLLVVPMLKNNELIGCISIYRQEVRPFTNKQIELVSNFAR